MNNGLIALAGLGVGAGVMYLADPHEGKRRRARMRELTLHTSHTVKAITGMTSRDVEHRLSGVVARTVARYVENTPPDDDVLAARVRARMGRLVSHPGAIDVTANNGMVTLSGPIFEAELEQLMNGVAAVPGVTGIENRLARHRDRGHVPGLQGKGPLTLGRTWASWRRWTPTARLVAGAAGLALVAWSAPNRPARTTTGIAGIELLERALLGTRLRA